MAETKKELSAKHRLFVAEYLRTWNATDAYVVAYPKASRETARRNGSLLLTNTDIKAEIDLYLNEKVMSANEVLARLTEQARSEQSRYITASGGVNLAQMIADGKSHLIKGIKRTQFGDKVEFYDAQAAQVHIGKHHGLFTDVSETKTEIEIIDATDPRERIASRIAGIAQRTGTDESPERPDDRGSGGA